MNRPSSDNDSVQRATRLTAQAVQVGQAYRLDSNTQRYEKQIHELIQAAELKASDILEQGYQEAERVLEAARQQADEMIQSAGAVQEAARQAGYDEGYQAARAQAEADSIELLRSSQRLLEGAYIAEQRILNGFQQSAARIITHLTQKILHRAFACDTQLLLEMIEHSVNALQLSGKTQVVVHPDTLDVIQRYGLATGQALKELTRLQFIADPVLGPSEIFVLNQEGSFSLTPEKQLAKLIEPLIQRLPVRETSPEVEVKGFEMQLPKAVLEELSEKHALLEDENSEITVEDSEDCRYDVSDLDHLKEDLKEVFHHESELSGSNLTELDKTEPGAQ